jgi:hypothetical protein
MDGSPENTETRSPQRGGSIIGRLFARWFRPKEAETSGSGHHRHRHHKKRNPVSAWFWKRLEKLAEWAEKRRQHRRRKKREREHNRRHRRERWRNHPVRVFFRNLFRKRRHGVFSEAQRDAAELKRQRKRLVYFAINSAMIFIITYFIAYLTYQLAVMLTASRWGINSVLLYYEVFWPMGNNSDKWNTINIITITFMGPFVSLVMGIIYMVFYVRRDRLTGLKKLFYLWLGFHSLNFFFGAFLGGMITYQGFGYVIGWSYMPTWLIFGLALIFLFILGLVGYLHTHFYLESSGSVYWTQKGRKPWLILAGALAPWLFSVFFLFFMKYPRMIPQHANIAVYDTIIYCTMVFPIAGMFANYRAIAEYDKTQPRSSARIINWIYLVIFIGAILLIRLGLKGGLYYLPY